MSKPPEVMWVFPKKDWFNAGASTHPIPCREIAKDVKYIRADLTMAREWQPIETAPANTPLVVSLINTYGERRNSFLRKYECAGEIWWATADDDSQISFEWEPTHWQSDIEFVEETNGLD